LIKLPTHPFTVNQGFPTLTDSLMPIPELSNFEMLFLLEKVPPYSNLKGKDNNHQMSFIHA